MARNDSLYPDDRDSSTSFTLRERSESKGSE
jgi:hypothetical protein